jgi:hypothetical protein
MRILAYCDQRYEVATRKVVGKGALVFSSPPWHAGNVKPEWFTYKDVVYLHLHGLPGSAYMWSGQAQEIPALHADMFQYVSVGGAVVVALTCHLPQTPFLRAFLDAGAVAVIGGHGENWGGRRSMNGAQLLAADVIAAMRAGVALGEAMEQSRRRLSHNWRRVLARSRTRQAIADALEFEIFRRVNDD